MKASEHVIKEYINAYNDFDLPKMVSLFADDCVFENLSNSSSAMRVEGKKALDKAARESAKSFKEREQRITQQVIGLNEAAIQIEYRAVLATDLPNGLKAGQTLELCGASFFKFQNGKIKRLTDLS